MVTADQLLAHAVGDYLLQSDWMAREKTRRSIVALLHAVVYVLPFLLLSHSLPALLVIVVSHFVIDRWRLARYLAWLRNWLGPNRPWSECEETGSPSDRPAYQAFWLMIIVDNTMHVLINAAALTYL